VGAALLETAPESGTKLVSGSGSDKTRQTRAAAPAGPGLAPVVLVSVPSPHRYKGTGEGGLAYSQDRKISIR